MSVLQILKPKCLDRQGKGNEGYELVEENLASITNQVKGIPTCVIGVAGPMRKGKSFFLNIILQYLEYLEKVGYTSGWRYATPMEGFTFRSGSERTTIGIDMWSKPYIVKDPNGEKIAVLLMDTQGTFDHDTTFADASGIFALSTLMSSLQIANLSSIIKEDDLQHFSVFMQHAKNMEKRTTDRLTTPGTGTRQSSEAAVSELASDLRRKVALSSDSSVTQKLLFLIRDWEFPDSEQFGYVGGQDLLNAALADRQTQSQDMMLMRKEIKANFQEIKCFLMPHPGKKAGRKAFTGILTDLDDEFVDFMVSLVEEMMRPENLPIKEIQGRKLTGGELFIPYQSYAKLLASGEVPPPSSMNELAAEVANTSARRVALEANVDEMDRQLKKFEGMDPRKVTQKMMDKAATACEQHAIRVYNQWLEENVGSERFNERIYADFIEELRRHGQYVKDQVTHKQNEASLKKMEEEMLAATQLQNRDKARLAQAKLEFLQEKDEFINTRLKDAEKRDEGSGILEGLTSLALAVISSLVPVLSQILIKEGTAILASRCSVM